MLKGHQIICFGPSDFWAMNPSCATHIMTKLSTQNRIIYINPISSDLFGIHQKKGLVARFTRKLKSTLKFIRKVRHNFYVASPVFLPMQGNHIIDRLNNILIKTQIKLLMALLGFRNPLLWIENIRAADFINSFCWSFVIYHVSDRFEDCSYTRNRGKLRLREAAVSKSSDLIICVSKQLYQHKKNSAARVYYLPHGVDFDKFHTAYADNNVFEKLKNIRHPVAGYFGTLTANNDIELLEYCAERLSQVTFIFAGRITGGDYSRLIKLSNTIFTGRVPYEQIPHLCVLFDLCLLPWKMSKWIVSCNPLKLFEYMACGKPIVSVPINEVVCNYSEIVSIAGNKEDFCRAITWELQNDTTARREKRTAVARQHSWNEQIDSLSCLIQQGLSRKTG
ncbi:MAG: glycosyltransferase [Planctomycetota bacterium]